MKLSKLMKALENYEEAPIPESVVAVAEGNAVDPQIVDAQAPVNEPSTIVDAGEMPAGVPEVSPLPIIAEAPIVSPVADIPAAVEGEGVVGAPIPLETGDQLIIESPLDHDNTMAMMDNTIVESTAMGNELTEIVETQVAMEAYAKLLRQAGPDGITRQAAGFMRVGLEQFQHDGHVDFSQLIASMEDMGEGDKQHLVPAKLKSDSLGSKIKELAAKVWEWLKGLWEKSKTFVTQLLQGVVGLERKLKKAQSAAQAAGSKSGGEFKVPNPDRIAIAGKVTIGYPNELKAVSMLATNVYPERMAEFYNAVAAAIGNFDVAAGDSQEVMGKLEDAKAILDDVKATDRPLPGGVKIDVSESGVSFGIAEGEGGDVSETTAQARSGSTIASDLKDMFIVLEGLKGYGKRHEAMSAAAAKVGQALEKLKTESSGENLEDAAATTAEEITSAVGKLLHQANPRGNEIVRYLARTTSAYADVILAELKVDGAAGSDSKEVAVA
ncbi:internal head protein [Pseudomonas phage Psa21]|uniref:Virion structural protein n=1 Tax=Pseudomonas phage Psa21 TaxID=2530023 RepID=A0A481W573_9CAUD|nr:internal head protein [Pseudomonas phage Psa21]QBJ02635.1 virion structural protein [Pseudomonas phage Psa21]